MRLNVLFGNGERGVNGSRLPHRRNEHGVLLLYYYCVVTIYLFKSVFDSALCLGKDVYMSYTTAIKTLPAARRATVEGVLDSWETGSQTLRNVGRNLRAEVNLPPKLFTKFLLALSDKWRKHPKDIVETGNDYDAVCSNFFLRGTLVQGQPVRIAGRASQLNSFVDNLYKFQFGKIPVGLSPKRMKANLRRLASDCRMDPATGRKRIQKFFGSFKQPLELARKPVWCTFRNPTRNICPFVDPLTTSANIANALGLPNSDDCGEMILFRYSSSRLLLFIPTVADARLYGYFTPAKSAAEHGWTTPLDERKIGGNKQPEAVHDTLPHNADDLMLIHVN